MKLFICAALFAGSVASASAALAADGDMGVGQVVPQTWPVATSLASEIAAYKVALANAPVLQGGSFVSTSSEVGDATVFSADADREPGSSCPKDMAPKLCLPAMTNGIGSLVRVADAFEASNEANKKVDLAALADLKAGYLRARLDLDILEARVGDDSSTEAEDIKFARDILEQGVGLTIYQAVFDMYHPG